MTPPGTTDRCGEFHLVEEGDDCAVIASEYGITKKDLYVFCLLASLGRANTCQGMTFH
jgi:hypothetical protein